MGFTATVAERACALRFEDLPDDVVELAKQCLLDFFGVTLAGAAEPTTTIVLDELLEERGGVRGATVIGHGVRLPMVDAALVNGTASHTLDYDDVNRSLFGHPTVPVAPAVLALAEHLSASGAAVIEAFVAGYEAENTIGTSVGPDHYDRGFHATGTVGTFGAAAASARLMRLDAATTATALGLAAAQAAGLKSMFGTMTKPLHTGKAAANGLLAARLAARGFTANPSALEAEQGFAEVLGDRFRPERALDRPERGFFLRNNLFKYHAACYETHSTIEGLRRLRADLGIEPNDIEHVVIHVDAARRRMCAIPDPTTGLECKFSLRHTAAMALSGADTSAVNSYTDDSARDAELVQLRSRIETRDGGRLGGPTPVEVTLRDGRTVRAEHDVNIPDTDLGRQRTALEAKFRALTEPLLGVSGAGAVVDAVGTLEHLSTVRELLHLVSPSTVGGA